MGVDGVGKGDPPNHGVVGDVPNWGNGEAGLGSVKCGRGDWGRAFAVPSRKSPECNAERGLWISPGDPSSSVALAARGYSCDCGNLSWALFSSFNSSG